MPTSTLETVEKLVDQLNPADRVRLMQYLVPRINAQAAEGSDTAKSGMSIEWKHFRELGMKVAAASTDPKSLTDMISQMRR